MDRWIGRATGWLESLVAVLLFAMMAITFVDVTGRYLFARPLPGSTEIIQVLLAVAVGCALPSVTWRQEHISIGLFDSASPGPWERGRRVVVALAGAVVFALLAALLWQHAGESAANEDVIGYLRLPVAPMVRAIAILSGATAFVFVALAWREGHRRDGQAQPALDAGAREYS